MTIVKQIERNPAASFPRATGSAAELEGFYRFTTNAKFSPGDILDPHFASSVERARSCEEVLALHDSSDIDFAGETQREGLGRTSAAGSQGFLLHASLLCSTDGTRTPLGLSALCTLTRAGQPLRPKRRRKAVLNDPKRESLRWWEGVQAVESRLGRPRQGIHVIDAAGDMFELLQQLVAQDPRQTKRKHPARSARTAKLAFSSTKFTLRRTEHSNMKATGATVHVVRAWEPSPPKDEAPIEWLLLTTEPVDTIAQILRVVDHYRARWLIEDYFKALKTGCSLEKRQSGSYQALTKITALLAPVAYRLLLLRGLERQNPTGSASAFFDEVDLALMQMDDATSGMPPPRFVGCSVALPRTDGWTLEAQRATRMDHPRTWVREVARAKTWMGGRTNTQSCKKRSDQSLAREGRAAVQASGATSGSGTDPFHGLALGGAWLISAMLS